MIYCQDDTDGMVQSLLSDDEEELSFSSYTTAKASQLTTDTCRTLVLSEPSDYVVDDEQFHTLQDVEDLTPDTAANNHLPLSLLAVNPEHVSRFVSKYNAVMPVGQGTDWCPDKNIYSGYICMEINLSQPINLIHGTKLQLPSIYNIRKLTMEKLQKMSTNREKERKEKRPTTNCNSSCRLSRRCRGLREKG